MCVCQRRRVFLFLFFFYYCPLPCIGDSSVIDVCVRKGVIFLLFARLNIHTHCAAAEQ